MLNVFQSIQTVSMLSIMVFGVWLSIFHADLAMFVRSKMRFLASLFFEIHTVSLSSPIESDGNFRLCFNRLVKQCRC